MPALPSPETAAAVEPADLVDPFHGVDGPGHTICGSFLPFSLVRLGPDARVPHTSNGYDSDSPIQRFSHTHVSGTGGGGRYGNVGVMPFTGPARSDIGCFPHRDETGEPGYYATTLLPAGIRAELTSTPRVGVHRYTFPSPAGAHIQFDLGAVVQVAGDTWGENTGLPIGGWVEFTPAGELVGRSDFRGGWGHEFPYSVHFCARFSRAPLRVALSQGNGPLKPLVRLDGPGLKAVASFDAPVVELRVGISYVSVANARASIDREAAGAGFDDLRARAKAVWNRELSRVRVDGGSEEHRRLFYSLMTRLFCMPSDLGVDEENPFWHSGVRHFTDFYALWDSVRNANQLIALIHPRRHVEMLNCLLDIADHTGWLVDAWIQGHSAMIQGGSSADILFCEAALKGFAGLDYEKALRHMRRNAEQESPDPWLYGRHLADYRDRGYVSTRVPKGSASRHLEYSYQDWCIGRLAGHLGKDDVERRYLRESAKVWNLWRDDLKCFAPRDPDGGWREFDPARCLPDCWNDPWFYEGTARQWSFNVQHDFAGLVRRHGGPEGFVRHLDEFFARDEYQSKETMLHVPCLYHYAGRPDLSCARVRERAARHFRPGRRGLTDNEDMGCQSAWFMWSALGLYPIMGQDLYLVTTPFFSRSEISLGEDGPVLTIETDGDPETEGYISAATLNGRRLDRAWLRHSEIACGGHLLLALSAEPLGWGDGVPPPSPLAGGR